MSETIFFVKLAEKNHLAKLKRKKIWPDIIKLTLKLEETIKVGFI